MPDRIYSIQYNGRIYEVRASDTTSPNELFAFVRSQAGGETQGPKGKEEAGFWGSFMEGAQTLGLGDEAAAFAANPTEANRRALLKAGESKYRQVGFGEGENWEAFKQLAGGSLGQLVAPVAAGLAATPLTTPLGGLAAASAVSGSQYTAQNLLRQAQEQERAIQEGRTPEETSTSKALLAATGQTALDLAGGKVFSGIAKAFPFMRPLLGESGEAAAREAGAILEDAVQKGTVSFAGNVARGVGKGVAFEVPQEIAQQGLERWQAGLSLSDEGALGEYKQAAIGAALLGGGFGAVAGAVTPRTKDIQTEEEVLSEREGLEGEVEATGLPEAADPDIRARAAELMQSMGLDATTAVEAAVHQRDRLRARLQQEEAPSVAEEPDLGGSEPDVSGVSGAAPTGEPAGAPTGAGRGPVGGVGLPAGQPVAGEAEVKSPLEPQGIIPPIEAVSPQAQFNQQMAAVEEAAPVAAPPVAEEAAPEQEVSEIAGTPEQISPAPTEVSELTPKIYVDRYLAGEGRGNTPADLELQQYAANNPAEIEAEFATRVAPEEAPPTVAETATVEKVAPAEAAPVAEEAAPAVELPPEVLAAQAEVDQYNPGFEIRYNAENGRRRYSYGLPGGKNIFASPNLNSVKNRILNETPVQPKQTIEGVPVKQLPPGEARGAKEGATREAPLQIEPPSQAGKLTRSQEQEQSLVLFEINEARNAGAISNAENAELLNMLRAPEGKDLARSREWTLAAAIQSDIDALTKQGRELRTEERLTKEQKKLTPEKQKEFEARAKEIAKRTKEQEQRLAETKAGVYQRTREKLSEFKTKRRSRIEQLKRNYERGLIDKVTFKREMSEARPQFRRAKGKAAGITLEELNTAVKDITSRWGARLEPKLVQSATDLPPAIRKELEDLGRTDAYGFYKDGKAYLIADNMNGVEDVAPTLYHEALGHLGLRERFQDGLDQILTDIYRTNKRVAALADKWLSANKDLYAEGENPTARAVEEVLATASEKGPLSASRFDKLVKYIKDFARKYLGLDFKFSDREVHTILAMAHEQALSGEGTVMGSSSVMFSAPEEQAANRSVANADVEVGDAIGKIATTTADRMDMEGFSRGFFGNINASLKDKSLKNWFGGLKNPSVSTGFTGRGGLDFLPTDGVLDYAETKIGKNPTTAELRNAIDAADRMNGTRSSTRRMLNRVVTDLKNYLLSNADSMVFEGKRLKALPLAADYGNYYNIDMVKLMDAETRDAAFRTDQVWRRYNKLLQNTALEPAKKQDFEAKLKKRETEIEGAMQIVSNLSKTGRTLYTRIRNMHRDMQEVRQFLMDKRIEALRDAGLSEDAVSKLMVSIRAEQERLNDRVNAPDKEDAHKDYPEVPLGLFHREYFPKRRYGQYWLRIKKTKFGEPILRFYEDAAERDADMIAAAEEFNLNVEDPTQFDKGNNAREELGDDFDSENAFVKTLNLISGIDVATFTDSKKAQLRNDVYQLYLLSTPEGSGRKQFIKSKNRLGWSSDILRTVGTTAEEYASDIARLRFVPEIDRALNAAKKSIETVPPSQKALSRDFITNIEGRIQGEMEPQPKGLASKIVPWANQLAYISFLTAPATALVQVTALPMRVAPNLWGKYGMVPTTRAMGRYMNVFNNLPKLESATKAARKSIRIPTLMESNVVKNSRRHRDALTRATDEYGLIMPLSEFTMGRERTPQTATQGRMGEVTQKAYDAMTYLFDASEQLTREVAFMAAYDLEYDKLATAGLTPEQRQNKAIIAAKDTVNYTLGNYTNLNRPPVMKGSELARALFLFKQYSVITTRFFVQGFRAIFGGKTPRAERIAAIKEMTGVLGMGFMMGGVVGLPLYTLGMMALQALHDLLDDDEDRKERMKKNPITADSVELQFRYEWLPEHFGQHMLTDANGKKITLGDIILNGAVSEATGWNFGSRVSLDLAGMWFRAPKDADTWAQTINNALVENIPGASASLNIVSMGEEIAKGNVLKGLEVGLPAMVRAPIKAYRLSEEGVRTQTEKIKLSKDDISSAEIVGATLGFNPTQIAKVQQDNRAILNRTKELQEKKSELLGAYKRAVRRIQNGDADGQEEARKAFKDIMEYNKKVGNPYFGISYANIYKSLTGAAAEEKYDIQGMGLNQIESYYAEKTLGEK